VYLEPVVCENLKQILMKTCTEINKNSLWYKNGRREVFDTRKNLLPGEDYKVNMYIMFLPFNENTVDMKETPFSLFLTK